MKRKRNSKEEFIGRRRFELFKRDPLAIEMEGLFRKSLSDNYPNYLKRIMSERVENLFIALMKKWNCHFIPNWCEKDIPDIIKPKGYLNFIHYWSKHYNPSEEPFSCYTFTSGAFTVGDYGTYVETFLKRLERSFEHPLTKDSRDFERQGWIFKYLDGGYDDRGNVYIPIPPGSVPIIVDVGGLTEKDKGKVTEEIWKIIKPKIKEKRTSAEGPWKNIPAVRDPQELGFLSAMAEDTFLKYLKWYDLHMGGDNQTPKGLPFRTIALYELVQKKYPDKLEEVKRSIQERTKSIKTQGGKEREIKGYIGEPVKGEDIVEKGVKLIYRAIHRKTYPSKKRQELYNCPQHGDKCTDNCPYLKKWMKGFNKRQMLFKPLYTTDPSGLENIPARNK